MRPAAWRLAWLVRAFGESSPSRRPRHAKLQLQAPRPPRMSRRRRGWFSPPRLTCRHIPCPRFSTLTPVSSTVSSAVSSAVSACSVPASPPQELGQGRECDAARMRMHRRSRRGPSRLSWSYSASKKALTKSSSRSARARHTARTHASMVQRVRVGSRLAAGQAVKALHPMTAAYCRVTRAAPALCWAWP